MAVIRVNCKQKYLGIYDTAELAYSAYCVAAIKYHEDFAHLG
jgi:hypothetical protein